MRRDDRPWALGPPGEAERALVVVDRVERVPELVQPGWDQVEVVQLSAPRPPAGLVDVVAVAGDPLLPPDLDRILSPGGMLAPGGVVLVAPPVRGDAAQWAAVLAGWRAAGCAVLADRAVAVLVADEGRAGEGAAFLAALDALEAADRAAGSAHDGDEVELQRVREVLATAVAEQEDARAAREHADDQAREARDERDAVRAELSAATAETARVRDELGRVRHQKDQLEARYRALRDSRAGRATIRYWQARKRLAARIEQRSR